MNLAPVGEINREEWLAYLQVKGDPDEQLSQQMAEAEQKLLRKAQPKFGYRICSMEELPVEGFSIQKHLEGCDKALVMAVTLGAGIDQMIRTAQISSVAEAVLLDTGASVLADQMADEAEQKIRQDLALKMPGQYLTRRFSPGYGDYPLHFQREMLQLVDGARRLGISLTETDMMVPHKSITAVIGLADHPVEGRLATCGECVLRSKCTLIKEGKHCYDY